MNLSWEKHKNGKPVWKYFLKSVVKKEGKSNRFACKCNYCNIIMDGKPQMMFKHLISSCTSITLEGRAEVILLHKTQMLDQVQQAITTDLTATAVGDGHHGRATTKTTTSWARDNKYLQAEGGVSKSRKREIQQAAQELGRIMESAILKLRDSATQSSVTAEYSKRCKELEDGLYILKQEHRNLRIEMARNTYKNASNNTNDLKSQLEIIIAELEADINIIEHELYTAQGSYSTSLQTLKRIYSIINFF